MTYQAFFEVRCGQNTTMVGLTVDTKGIDGDAHAKALQEDLFKMGRTMTVSFVCVADHLTYEHSTFDSAVRMLDSLQ